MTEHPSTKQLMAIIASFEKPMRPSAPDSYRRLAAAIFERGYASFPDIEDVFHATDARLYNLRHEIAIRDWCSMFDIPLVDVFPQPRATQATCIGSKAVRISDFAKLLMLLERLGYSVDPAPYVELLTPQLCIQNHVTCAELSVILYKKERQKMVPLELSIDKPWPDTKDVQTMKSETGYQMEAWLGASKQPFHLISRAPKYRRKRAPVRTICAMCGVEWYRGDPDSSALHRRQHKERLTYLEPKPVPRFVSSLAESRDEGELVLSESASWKHREIYQRALAFRRKFAFDFVQWGSPKGDDDPSVHGFLFAGPGDVIAGACAFRLREYEGRTWWGLQWVWVAPNFRRKGLLSSRWAMFRERFGNYHIETPLSKGMQSFLSKHDISALAAED